MQRVRFTLPVRYALAWLVALALVLPAPAAFTARAATRVVTSLLDNGVAGTLRLEVLGASSGDTITFQPGLTGTIILGGLQLLLDRDLTIQGPGAANLTISGDRMSRVFDVPMGKTVAISGLTVANGVAFADSSGRINGGGIRNAGTLTVTNSTFSGNVGIGNNGSGGGGIYNGGTLAVTNSTFSGNTGSGISNDGTLTVAGSTFSGNTSSYGGGGIFTVRAATITGSTFSGNHASDIGGGIATYFFDHPSDVLTVTNSTFSSNESYSGGGIGHLLNGGLVIAGSTFTDNVAEEGGALSFSGRTLTVTGSAFTTNRAAKKGGGIALRTYPFASMRITESTFTGNVAYYDTVGPAFGGNGGGIHREGSPLVVTNCTFTNNAANYRGGGGIYDYGYGDGGGIYSVSSGSSGSNATDSSDALTVTGSTFSGNTAARNGGAISSGDGTNTGGTLTVTNSTLRDNTATAGGGGIYRSSLLTLTDSTLSGNTAYLGGGLYGDTNRGTTMTNTTLSGNTALTDGGGVATRGGSLVLRSVTIAGNKAQRPADGGGGIYQTTGDVQLVNVLLSLNETGNGGQGERLRLQLRHARRGVHL